VTVTPLATVHRLLAGPDPRLGPEPLRSHLTRLGARPRGTAGTPPPFVGELERSGLRGRGGAAFPTARKWSAVASRSRGHAVVVANGSEGEPASWKDRTLMALRPHLVIDGLLLAAETVGAAEAVIYLPRAFDAAHASLSRAIDERREQGERLRTRLRIAAGPHRYVAGEESAVVAHLNGGEAKPTVTPPRPFERGVMGRPTLVQNVETLAHTALIARLGSGWFRSAGTAGAPGTALCSIGGAVAAPGLVEIALGTTVAELVAMAGGGTAPPEAVLIGGYGGRWLPAATALPAALGVDVPLGPESSSSSLRRTVGSPRPSRCSPSSRGRARVSVDRACTGSMRSTRRWRPWSSAPHGRPTSTGWLAGAGRSPVVEHAITPTVRSCCFARPSRPSPRAPGCTSGADPAAAADGRASCPPRSWTRDGDELPTARQSDPLHRLPNVCGASSRAHRPRRLGLPHGRRPADRP
jgi:hypothetical protein